METLNELFERLKMRNDISTTKYCILLMTVMVIYCCILTDWTFALIGIIFDILFIVLLVSETKEYKHKYYEK